MLYQIFIYPIEIILEVVYFFFDRILDNVGASILGVSLAIQIITLPLYTMAEKWQKIERDVQSQMKPGIDRIKSVFKGDEQYMVLSTFYKQHGYHPIFVLRSTIGLLIQIPFFIAAYTFLSNQRALQGIGFLFISNLGAPDAFTTIGNSCINLLPILMTMVNIISTVIYAKGFSFREKIQLHAITLLFLMLLYNSPSGLVLYWTMNNIFSLIKTLFFKLKKPLRVFYFIILTVSFIATFYCVFILHLSINRIMLVCILTLILSLIPFFVYIFKRFLFPLLNTLNNYPKMRLKMFLVSCFALFLLSGYFIPSALTASSPQEFSYINDFNSPLELLVFPLCHSIGIFLLWIPLLYCLFSSTFKNVMAFSMLSFFFISLFYTFVFTGTYGNITSSLKFDSSIPVIPTVKTLVFDSFIVLSVLIGFVLLLKFKIYKVPVIAYSLISVALLVIGFFQFRTTHVVYEKLDTMTGRSNSQTATVIEPVYTLSPDDDNVIIFMLDRGIASFIPYIFEESLDIKQQFTGFTYYPNTVSFGDHTKQGSPPLYGGYEYIPSEFDKSNKLAVQMHNEALTVLPRVFLENNFDSVTITDASYANYSHIPDNSIFNEWNINAQNIIGTYTDLWLTQNNDYVADKIHQSRLIAFSFFRMLPTSLRGGLYLNSAWWFSERDPVYEKFIEEYTVLDYLPELTVCTGKTSSLNMIINNITHEPVDLQYPNYDPKRLVTNTRKNTWGGDDRINRHYQVNFVALKKLGEFFDYLRDNDVYDNTRIIIVSDHGYPLNIPIFEDFLYGDTSNLYPARFNTLLMVKDFNKQNEVMQDMTFMTNADVPFLATYNIIDNAKNPYSNNLLKNDMKKNGVNLSVSGHITNALYHGSNAKSEIWLVKDNIFNTENWTKLEN